HLTNIILVLINIYCNCSTGEKNKEIPIDLFLVFNQIFKIIRCINNNFTITIANFFNKSTEKNCLIDSKSCPL
uniref:hypothetical protein n=1 Tax=Enterococcus faecalis TaxID=1351 RepID=UPI001C42F867